MNKRSVGKQGEALAKQYLIEKGFKCIAQNYYTRNGEIDLVMSKDDVLYMVEVKYRTSRVYGGPRSAMTPQKIHHLTQACQYYLLKNPWQGQYKIAFLGMLVRENQIEYDWLENIFE